MQCRLCGAELLPRARRCPGCGAWQRGGALAWWLLVVLLLIVPLWLRYHMQPAARAKERARAAVAACWQEAEARRSDPEAAAWVIQECRRLEARLETP